MDYIDTDSIDAKVSAEFKIYGENILYEVGYQITLKKETDGVFVERELLNCAINTRENRTYKKVFMDYQRNDSDNIFKPQKRLDELVGKNKDKKMDLIVAKKMAEKSNCSYIFGENSREIFCDDFSGGFEPYATVIRSLYQFALKDLFVIKIKFHLHIYFLFLR